MFFHVTNQGVVYCVNGETGEEVWKERVGGAFCASPVVAGDLIYFCDEKGKTFVIRAATEFKQSRGERTGRRPPLVAGDRRRGVVSQVV